jgi:polysaccharide deacetylase
MLNNTIPLLTTLDVHEHPELISILNRSGDWFLQEGERVTYFVPAGLVCEDRRLAGTLRGLKKLGHSVGCHGLDHSPAQDLARLNSSREMALLREATRILEDATGNAITCFRAPNFRLSNRTLPFLAELGYKADSSVTPQRIPILSSCPWCFGWICAPASPYHPSFQSPFRRGDVPLLEIPTSCLLVPLAHGTIANLDPCIVGVLLRTLTFLAQRFETVIVPMLHPESVVGKDLWSTRPAPRWKDFIPLRYGGMNCRYYFAQRDPIRITNRVVKFVAATKANSNLLSMSVDDFLERVASRSVTPAGRDELHCGAC